MSVQQLCGPVTTIFNMARRRKTCLQKLRLREVTICVELFCPTCTYVWSFETYSDAVDYWERIKLLGHYPDGEPSGPP